MEQNGSNHYEKEDNMSHENGNGGINFSDAGILALMADTNRAGRGGGYGYGGEGGGYGCNGPYSSPTGTAVRLDRNESTTRSEADCIRNVHSVEMRNIADRFEDQTRAQQFADISARIRETDVRNTDNQFRAELRIQDQMAALREKQAQDTAAAALCCCKLEAQAATNHGVILAQNASILATLAANKEIADLRMQLEMQRLKAECGCGCGGGVRTCNNHHHPQ